MEVVGLAPLVGQYVIGTEGQKRGMEGGWKGGKEAGREGASESQLAGEAAGSCLQRVSWPETAQRKLSRRFRP